MPGWYHRMNDLEREFEKGIDKLEDGLNTFLDDDPWASRPKRKRTSAQRSSRPMLAGREQIFSQLDLSGASFRDANLQRATFSQCDLTDADFRGSKLAGATFSQCDLQGADFRDTDWTQATFSQCDTEGTRFGSTTAKVVESEASRRARAAERAELKRRNLIQTEVQERLARAMREKAARDAAARKEKEAEAKKPKSPPPLPDDASVYEFEQATPEQLDEWRQRTETKARMDEVERKESSPGRKSFLINIGSFCLALMMILSVFSGVTGSDIWGWGVMMLVLAISATISITEAMTEEEEDRWEMAVSAVVARVVICGLARVILDAIF